MTGAELQKAIKDSGLTGAEIQVKSGVIRRTLFNLYKKETVEQHWIDKIKLAGVKFSETINDTNSSVKKSENKYKSLSEPEHQYNKSPKHPTNTGDTEITMLKTKIEHLEDQLEAAQIVIKEQTTSILSLSKSLEISLATPLSRTEKSKA